MSEQPFISIRKIQLVNVVLIAVMAIFALTFYGLHQALSVVVGGGLATVSFLWLKKDIKNIFSGPMGAAKILFFVKYYARLALVAVVLFLLVRHRLVEIFGLLFGLSTVVTSIVIAGIDAARKMSLSVKEAA